MKRTRIAVAAAALAALASLFIVSNANARADTSWGAPVLSAVR